MKRDSLSLCTTLISIGSCKACTTHIFASSNIEIQTRALLDRKGVVVSTYYPCSMYREKFSRTHVVLVTPQPRVGYL